MKNLVENLTTLKATYEAVKAATKCYGLIYTYKDLSGDETDYSTMTVQLQLSEDAFINLVESLGMLEEVFYHTSRGSAYGYIDYAGCQFYYIC